jgi:HD superfamily phosphodiesterase
MNLLPQKPKAEDPSEAGSIALTVSRYTRDNAGFMAIQKSNSESMIESRFPGLIADVRKIIQDSENAYEGGDGHSESQLWEHTVHVTSIAYRLACAEGLNPLIPSIAALFHDAGKFAGGRYHKDETIEEEESAQIAERLLLRFGMKKADIRTILSGLRALYNEKARKNAVAAILHDADFLSKFGALGIAAFFTKSVLRGRTLRSSVLGFLSKELTYATCLPMNMRTETGRRLAGKKAADSIKFFRALLAELREARIADLKIRKIRIPHPSIRDRFLEVQLVESPACPKCGERWQMAWTIEKGVKCTKLSVDWDCPQCNERVETSFCLPEVA